MKKTIKIRKGLFETNSSSTHSITICLKEEFELFKEGTLVWDKYNEKLTTPDERNCDLKTYDDWGSYLESFSSEYTTKSGEVIVAFGEYGHDG